MSSLLQFSGNTSKKGVQLQAYLVKKIWKSHQYVCHFTCPVAIRAWSYSLVEAETEHCPTCGQSHAKLYGFWRKPVGMWGCWVVFRYNGEEHVPDISIPLSLEKLPRDAKPLPIEYWHSK